VLVVDELSRNAANALLQQLNRDTQRMAFKCSAIQLTRQHKVDGVVQYKPEWVEVFKDPITSHDKQSKKGRVKTYQSDIGGFRVVDELVNDYDPNVWKNAMVEVFRNGQILHEYALEDIRKAAI